MSAGGRHLAFVGLNTALAALSSAALFGLFARREWISLAAPMVAIAALTNLFLYPVATRCRTWGRRIVAFGVAFSLSVIVFAAFVGFEAASIVASRGTPYGPSPRQVIGWHLYLWTFYGHALGFPFLALTIVVNYALRRRLFPETRAREHSAASSK
jgi:hypothetical protein